MNLNAKTVDGVRVFWSIDLESQQGVTDFKNFWKDEFEHGQQLFFLFYRLESLTEDHELTSIENCKYPVFPTAGIGLF